MYEEFGSILLLVLLIQSRFKLYQEELTNGKPSSFLHHYLRLACVGKSINDLSEKESESIGVWIQGLFDSEGISDDLMSKCTPQQFHLLVGTLFDQSLKACQAKVLNMETLKGGFDCEL